MCLIFCLSVILTEFRPLFKYQNFHLFSVFVVGLINQREGATLTGIYQAVDPKTGYYSLVKFLSRGKWDADAVAKSTPSWRDTPIPIIGMWRDGKPSPAARGPSCRSRYTAGVSFWVRP